MAADPLEELPEILEQLGELESHSIYTKDWKEAIDPIWGRRYYVNRWSGQIIHRLAHYGIASVAAKLTLWFSNLSLKSFRQHADEEYISRTLRRYEELLHPYWAGLSDVPDNMIEVKLKEVNPDDPPSPDSTRRRKGESDDEEDSIMGDSGGLDVSDIEPGSLKLVVRARAPGVRVSLASGGFKRAMEDQEKFQQNIITMISKLPSIGLLRVNALEPIDIVRAEMEEFDVPRVASSKAEPEPPPPEPPPVLDEDIIELAANMMYAKPRVLQMPCRKLGPFNAQRLLSGLELVPLPHLEELGLWGCAIGDGGAVALAHALQAGSGMLLQTLLLDDNHITALGAEALGDSLGRCPVLQELAVARNPIGSGLSALIGQTSITLTTLDATDAELDDAGAAAVGLGILRWSGIRCIRLGRNPQVTELGVEAIVKAMICGPKSIQRLDLQGTGEAAKDDWARLEIMLRDGDVDPGCLHLY